MLISLDLLWQGDVYRVEGVVDDHGLCEIEVFDDKGNGVKHVDAELYYECDLLIQCFAMDLQATVFNSDDEVIH